MKQTKLESLVEASLNTAIGFVTAMVTQRIVYPLFDIHISVATNFSLALCFTLVSIARNYAVRRWCNARLHGLARRISEAIRSRP